ncbi:hypothetical protein K458DRAFT_203534 [Lentithecium fluviatile CBS 122367]|uniref:Secreted protein n=1 Tax=Lentithecium fluviatile CBS 122367 TaxID=1168545 RepID=A0A6G1J9D9_9PLEO|nr:hypothetical protein K458DRAFT_203534 [Lentithecium fluviatile CBS 122367]
MQFAMAVERLNVCLVLVPQFALTARSASPRQLEWRSVTVGVWSDCVRGRETRGVAACDRQVWLPANEVNMKSRCLLQARFCFLFQNVLIACESQV